MWEDYEEGYIGEVSMSQHANDRQYWRTRLRMRKTPLASSDLEQIEDAQTVVRAIGIGQNYLFYHTHTP